MQKHVGSVGTNGYQLPTVQGGGAEAHTTRACMMQRSQYVTEWKMVMQQEYMYRVRIRAHAETRCAESRGWPQRVSASATSNYRYRKSAYTVTVRLRYGSSGRLDVVSSNAALTGRGRILQCKSTCTVSGTVMYTCACRNTLGRLHVRQRIRDT